MPKYDNIKRVAKEVIKQAESGELINVKEAMLKVGYSPSTAEHKSTEVVKSRTYQLEILKQQEQIRDRIIDSNEIMQKKKHKASYRDGVEAYDKLTKLALLLSGDKPSVQIQVNWQE